MLVENDPVVGRQRVQVGRAHGRIVPGHIVPAQIVRHDEHDVGRSALRAVIKLAAVFVTAGRGLSSYLGHLMMLGRAEVTEKEEKGKEQEPSTRHICAQEKKLSYTSLIIGTMHTLLERKSLTKTFFYWFMDFPKLGFFADFSLTYIKKILIYESEIVLYMG